MRIRRAEPDDLPAVLGISNWAAEHTPANFAVEPETLETWRESHEATHETHPWLVADDDGVVVGFAKASPWKGRCAYAYAVEVTVYVHPDHHRRGLGTALYARLFPVLRRQGYRVALGGITLPNPASVRLHEAFGLRCTAVFKRIGWKFGRWHDVGYWEGLLQESDEPPTAIRPVTDAMEG
jgi:phosphinothricin acetyltransferase